MAIATQMTVEEYLLSGFDPDCEFVDGEVLERNMGELDHSWTQRRLIQYFAEREAQLGVFALQSWTFKVTNTNYRIPDFVVIAGPEPNEQILTTRPLVCVEVLGSDDRPGPMMKKVDDYLSNGVRYVWILDPQCHQAFAYTTSGFNRLTEGVLRTENPAIEIPLNEIFE